MTSVRLRYMEAFADLRGVIAEHKILYKSLERLLPKPFLIFLFYQLVKQLIGSKLSKKQVSFY